MQESISSASSASSERWFVTSLERGLRVIRAFGPEAHLLRVSEVAERANCSRAAARRFLMTLEQLGYIGSDSQNRYYLRAAVLSLGYSYLSSLRVSEIVQPLLDDLRAHTSMASSLVVLDDQDIVYLVRAAVQRPIQMLVNPGDRLPAYATSAGQVLLASLEESQFEAYLANVQFRAFTPNTLSSAKALRARIKQTRNQGWAKVDSEIAGGIVSISVPVKNAREQTVAAININDQSGQLIRAELMEGHLSALNEAARKVGAAITALGPAFEPIRHVP